MSEESLDPPQTTKEQTLHHLLQKEHGYYRAILELTEQEREKYRKQRPLSEIASLMKRRKILMGCVDEIEGTLVPLKKHWIANKQGDHPLHKEIQSILEELDFTVGQILQLDEENQAALERHKEDLSRRSPSKFSPT